LGFSVKGRLNTISDLVSAEAVYHRKCYSAFHRLISTKPAKSSSGSVTGRPIAQSRQEALDRMCDLLERADDEMNTLADLVNKMKQVASDPDLVYSKKQLKRKFLDKYGDHIVFAEIEGQRNVICFRNMASCIITSKWYSERESNSQDESTCIVSTVAKLIKAEIRELQSNVTEYPRRELYNTISAAKVWSQSC